MSLTHEPYGEAERYKYLVGLPQDMREIVDDAADMFDMILNAELPGRHHTHEYHDGALYRTFRYISDLPFCMDGEIIMDTIRLRYSKLKQGGDAYAMQVQWGTDTTPEYKMFETTYLLEAYRNGPAYTYIEQNSLCTMRDGVLDMPEQRQMEPGDFTSLFKDLRSLGKAVSAAGNVRLELNRRGL